MVCRARGSELVDVAADDTTTPGVVVLSSVTTMAGDDVTLEVVVVVVLAVVEEVDEVELVKLVNVLADVLADKVDKVGVAEIVDEPVSVDPVATGPDEELPVEGATEVLIEAEPVVIGIGAVDSEACKSGDEDTLDVAVADALLSIAVDTGMELASGAADDDCAMVVATSD